MAVRGRTAIVCGVSTWVALGLLGCGPASGEGEAPTASVSGDPAAAGSTFTMVDVTAAAGIRWTHSFGDTHLSSILEDTGSGAAWIDHDGDGWLDLYLISGTHVPGATAILADVEEPLPGRSALWRNRGDGRFEDVTEAAGLTMEGYGVGAAVADYDGDGDEDLFLCNYGPNRLMRNRGDGTFEDATAEAGLAGPAELAGFTTWSLNAVWFDGDGDRDLDLYVTNYLAFDPAFRSYYLPEGMPGPSSYLGQPSLYYVNQGDGTFVERAAQAGFRGGPSKGMGASVADVDGDGDLDLFQANDTTANALFINDGAGHFTDTATAAGVAYNQGGETSAAMHGSWADVDHDGSLDLFVPDLTFGGLFINRGEGRFRDETLRSGIAVASGQYSGWGADLVDLDNDGHVDLFVANGKFHHLFPEQDLVMRGDGAGNFEDVTELAGAYFQVKRVHRGAAFADYDNDGDVDVAIVGNEVAQAPVLLRNEPAAGHHWLTVRVRAAEGLPEPIGARVIVEAGGVTQLREVQRSRSFLSSSDPRVHFGLGAATTVDRLTVVWPGGQRREVTGLEVDQQLTWDEGEEVPR